MNDEIAMGRKWENGSNDWLVGMRMPVGLRGSYGMKIDNSFTWGVQSRFP